MNISKAFCSIATIAASILGSATQGAEKPDIRVPENRVIYELFVRNFSADSKFKSVEAQIPRLKELGVDVIWLMPINKLGEVGLWGTYSSPYAVQDYYEVDPLYGTKDDFRSLVNTIHANGMHVWLDWVANHTSMDHVWVKSHPEYYVNGYNGYYHPSGWADVYELEYNNAGMRQAMIDAMKYWVTEFDIDGYRLDNTDGVPHDFWAQARQAVDACTTKELGWLAETGGDDDIVRDIFDYNYAWGYADLLRSIGSNSNVNSIAENSRQFYTNSKYNGKSRMVYLTNHDVVQDHGGTEDKWFGANLKPMTVLEFTIYGMPLIFNGQEVSYSHWDKIMLSERTVINWNGDASMTELMKKLTYLKHTEPALRTSTQAGELNNLSATNGNVYAFERKRGDYSVVVMLNFGGSQATFNVSSLPGDVYTDAFSGTVKDFRTNPSFTLPAHGYAVWTKDDSGVIPDPNPDPNPDPQPGNHTVAIAGSFNSWNAQANSVSIVNNSETSITISNWTNGDYGFKIVIDGTWYTSLNENVPVDGSWQYNMSSPSGEGNNMKLNTSAEGKTVKFTVNAATHSFKAEIDGISTPEPNPGDTYTITFVRPTAWTNTPHIHVYYTKEDAGTQADMTIVNDAEMTAVDGTANTFYKEIPGLNDKFTLIFNNGGWSNGQSNSHREEKAGNYTYTLDGDNIVYSTYEPAIPDPDPEPNPEPQPDGTYTITFVRPAGWTNTPHIHMYYPKEYTGANNDQDIVNNTAMTPVAGKANAFSYILSDLNDNFRVMFNNGGWVNGQSDSHFEAHPGNYTYTLDGENHVTVPVAYVITLASRPDLWQVNTPNVHMFYSESASGHPDEDIVNNQPMVPSDSEENVYVYTVYDLDHDYHVMFNNGGWANGQSNAHREPVAGNYRYNVDNDLLINKNVVSSIETTVATDSEAETEWYEITGRRVAHPTRGIYIMRRGSKVKKVSM